MTGARLEEGFSTATLGVIDARAVVETARSGTTSEVV